MDVLDLVAVLTLDSTQYDTGLRNAESRSSSFASKLSGGFNVIKTGAKVAFAAAEAAITAFAGSAVRVGAQFDASMAQVAATMGMTADQLQDQVGEVDLAWGKFTGNLREYAQETGAHTAFSASQSAEALSYMALAGYDVQTSMEMLPNVLNLAAAGGMELAQASDMVTDAQSALGLDIKRTTDLVSEMAKTASRSNTSVEQLGSAILTVGGTARQLHGGMIQYADGTEVAYDGTTELSAALGILADNGIKGAEGGTALRNVLTAMSGKKFAKTFGEMGVAVYDATGEMRPMRDILADMNTVMEGMTTEEKTKIIQNTFDARVLKSANALLGTTTERWNDLTAAIVDSQGAAEAMAGTQLDNLQGDITLFKSALEGTQIAISDGLTPTLREFTKFGAQALSELTEAIKSGGLMGAMEQLGDIIANGVDMIVEKLPSYVEAGTKLLTAVIEGITKNAGKFAQAAVAIIKTLIQAITNNLPTIISAGLEIVQELAKGIIQALPEMIPAIVDMLEGIVDILIQNLPLLIDAAIAIVEQIANGIVDALPRLVPKIVELMVKISETIVKNLPKIIKAAAQIAKTFVLELSKALGEQFPALKGVFEGLGKTIAGAFDWIEKNGDQVANIILKVAGALGAIKFAGFVGQGFNNFMGIFGGANGKGLIGTLSDLNGKFKTMEGAVGGFFSKLGNGQGLEMLKTGLGTAKEKINGFSDGLSMAGKGMLALSGAAIGISGISDAMNKLREDTENTGGAILELAGSTAASTASMVAAFGVPGGLVAGAVTALMGVFKGLYDYIVDFNMDAVGQAIHSALYTPGGVGLDVYSQQYIDLINNISEGSEQMKNKLMEISSARSSVEETAYSLGLISNAISVGAETLEEKLPQITSLFGQLYDDTKSVMDQEYEVIVNGVSGALSDTLDEMGVSVPGILTELGKLKDEGNTNIDGLKESFERLSEAYNSADNEFEKSRIGAQLEDVIEKMAKFQSAEVDQTTDKIEELGGALDLSRYIGDDNALSVDKFTKDMQGLANAAQTGVDNAKTLADESKASMDDWRAKLEALGVDTSNVDWEAMYGANDSTKNETLAKIAETYQAEADQIQEYLVNRIPAVIEEAQEQYANMSPIQKAFTDENAVVSQALADYKTNTIDPAMATLEEQFDTAFAGTGETLSLTAGEVTDAAMKEMFSPEKITKFGIDTYVAALDENWRSIFENVTNKFPEYGSNIGSGTALGVEETAGEATDAVQAMSDDMQNAFTKANDINSPSTVYHNYGYYIVQGLNEGIEDNQDSTVDVITKWVDSIAKATKESLEKIPAGFANIKKDLVDGFVKYFDEILKKIKDTYKKFKTAGSNIIQNIKKGAEAKVNDLKTLFSQAVQAIEKTFKSKDWNGIGKFIADGVAAGINAGKSKVIDAAVEMAVEAYKAAKAALDIESPSKKFRDGIGKNIALGLAEGIRRNKDEAVQAVEEMDNELLQQAQKRLDNFKVYHELSLQDEKDYWNKVRKLLQKGTQARIDADKAYYEAKARYKQAIADAKGDAEDITDTYIDAVNKALENRDLRLDKIEKNLNKSIQRVQDNLTKNLKSIDERLEKDLVANEEKLQKDIASTYSKMEQEINNLTKTYENSVKSRYNSVMGLTDLFQRTSFDSTYNSDYLMDTLEEQIDKLEQWDAELLALEGKLGAENPLLKALEDKGVGALYTLKELNTMTDEEIKAYSDLYAKKESVAQKRALQENETLRKTTEDSIQQARDNAEAEIKVLQSTAEAARAALREEAEKNRAELRAEAQAEITELRASAQEEIQELISESDELVSELTDNFISDISDMAETLKGEGKDVGVALIEGMLEGMLQNGNISGALEDVINDAISTLKYNYDPTNTVWYESSDDKGNTYGIELIKGKYYYVKRNKKGKLKKKTLISESDPQWADFFAGLTNPNPSSGSLVSKDDLSQYVPSAPSSSSKNTDTIGFFAGGYTQNITINAPKQLDASEVARLTKLANQQMILAMNGI